MSDSDEDYHPDGGGSRGRGSRGRRSNNSRGHAPQLSRSRSRSRTNANNDNNVAAADAVVPHAPAQVYVPPHVEILERPENLVLKYVYYYVHKMCIYL